MTEPSGAHGTVLAEAWEIRAGDELDGHPVAGATTSGANVVVTFGDGAPARTLAKTDEVTLTRWFALAAPAVEDGA